MSAIDAVPMGERGVRFEIPAACSRAALLDWLLSQADVADASLAAEHALVMFRERARPIVLPALDATAARAAKEHSIRVVYDGADLAEVAARASTSKDEVVARHTASVLTVSFLGFCPGFAYLVGLDAALASVPRRGTPRPRVPAGSVAIAGGYSGIYPAASAGGWQLLGRAIDAHLLDGDAPRFSVGDRVRFVAA